jgi:HD-GYP domain-containing protein (c-di-GMP phosphodiesterase class II)/anti-anti-sigma regulatory factor
MARTTLERLELSDPSVAAFRISGKLGFHENKKIQGLIEECLKRDFQKVLFDFSELSSLGGGVAKILREFVRTFEERGGGVCFVIKSDVVLQFLQEEGSPLAVYRTIDDALKSAKSAKNPSKEVATGKKPADDREPADGCEPADGREPADDLGPADNRQSTDSAAQSGVIFMSYDGEHDADAEHVEENKPSQTDAPASAPPKEDGTRGGEEEAGVGVQEAPANETGNAPVRGSNGSDEILSEIFDGGSGKQPPPRWINKSKTPFSESQGLPAATEGKEELNKQLRRKVLELKTLFSISTDFNSIRERKKLIDIFLLTSIAQGGVESAAFFEKHSDAFMPAFSKGLNTENLEKIVISNAVVESIGYNNTILPLDNFGMDGAEKTSLRKEGLEYICAFRQKDELTGLVLLGKRIAGRGMKEDDFEFLRILVNVAQGAYENALMFEREHDRTLGIVKTLISLIEENTLLKGSSEIVSRYVGMIAKNMDYTEEHFKDLIYGTVLRDMGMIKVSDLILRSPRELTKEEWEIIKRHPEDGAEMLRRMRFSDHVVEIVRTHHERFNGEGYPTGIRGKEIPFGSRIISVVESYAAMINERPNRPALNDREALNTLKENYGLRYDREIVSQFAKIMEKEIAKSVKPKEPMVVE